MPLREMFPGGVKVIGNFPYNISSQIFFKILENRDLVPESVGMVDVYKRQPLMTYSVGPVCRTEAPSPVMTFMA